MDSLTQIALGSALSVAAMGRRTAVWKAALWGAVAGTLPDLDAFIDHGNEIRNMVMHRGDSHALLYLTLLAPALAAAIAGLHRERPLFRRWWLAMWLALVTHPLLDNMTVYGTQLLRPFSTTAYGFGSIFIIDPLYTVPLIVGVLATLIWRKEPDRGLSWNHAGIVLSTLYLVWTLGAQHWVDGVARESLREQRISAEHLLVTATPFNTQLWRLVAVTPDRYYEAFYSVWDPDRQVKWTSHDRGADVIARYAEKVPASLLASFTRGFFSMRERQDGHVLITDLRMGLEPAYTFVFDLGFPEDIGNVKPRGAGSRGDVDRALQWLWQRMWGDRRWQHWSESVSSG